MLKSKDSFCCIQATVIYMVDGFVNVILSQCLFMVLFLLLCLNDTSIKSWYIYVALILFFSASLTVLLYRPQ